MSSGSKHHSSSNSAANQAKKAEEQKCMKIIKALSLLSHNKTCADCGQAGPTYVNMSVGSFVCTQCSGIIRGLNKPQRVKGLSMSAFTPDELEFLRTRGNEWAKRVWLGLYDPKANGNPPPLTAAMSAPAIKDFLTLKYDNRRWYLEPSEQLNQEAANMNAPAFVISTSSNTWSSMARGSSALPPPPSSANNNSAHATPASATSRTVPTAAVTSATSNGNMQPPAQTQASATQQKAEAKTVPSAAPSKPATTEDLLGDIFSAAPPAPPPTSSNAAGWGNFDPFSSGGAASAPGGAPFGDSFNSSSWAPTQTQPAQAAASNPFGATPLGASSGPLIPTANNASAANQAPRAATNTPAAPAPPAASMLASNSDRYAAIAALDCDLTSQIKAQNAQSQAYVAAVSIGVPVPVAAPYPMASVALIPSNPFSGTSATAFVDPFSTAAAPQFATGSSAFGASATAFGTSPTFGGFAITSAAPPPASISVFGTNDPFSTFQSAPSASFAQGPSASSFNAAAFSGSAFGSALAPVPASSQFSAFGAFANPLGGTQSAAIISDPFAVQSAFSTGPFASSGFSVGAPSKADPFSISSKPDPFSLAGTSVGQGTTPKTNPFL